MKNIIITTTFRDFQGNNNDKMQMNFLNSLKKQTYQKFSLVVTTFGEKKVEEIVSKALPGKVFFYHEGHKGNYRYSPTDVVLNGIEHGKKNPVDIVVDCSADIILQKNFLEVVAYHYDNYYSGISHPNIFYEINSNYHVEMKRMGSCNRGIDIRFFDYKLLLDNEEILKRYKLVDWGGIESLLGGISFKFGAKKINIFSETKVIKIENDREAANENNAYIRKSFNRNSRVLRRFIKEMRFKEEDLFDMFYLHKQYKMTRNSYKYMWNFRNEYVEWINRNLKRKLKKYF